MKDYGLVSIITPSWNCGKFVEETIRSVQAQTYTNWELLFQDDCSNDDTRQIVERLASTDSRIHYECNLKNSGAAVTRNNALRRTTGRWIAFLDADDLWYSEKLEIQLAFMVDNNYHFSCTFREQIDEYGKSLGLLLKSPHHISKRGMYRYCWIGCLTVIYDYNHVGLIQIADIKKNNDYAIWLKVIQKTDCYCIPKSLGYYRVRSGSISRHSKTSLIKWHYRLFKDAEGQNTLHATYSTIRNLMFGIFKKTFYYERIK